jgi:hypothetical protein
VVEKGNRAESEVMGLGVVPFNEGEGGGSPDPLDDREGLVGQEDALSP